jgi:hypothetical protein
MTRIAVSIQTLGNEVHDRSPNTVLYYYDDTPRRDSDHDPNLHGVVCAIDIMAGHGLDLHALSREIVAARHPECAYVIFNRQIASRNTGWEWVDYHGDNPHTDHIHASAGTGPDGYKEPPYDSTRPWLKNGPTMFLAACKIGDSGSHVQFLQYSLHRIHADRYPDEPPLWPVVNGVPQIPPTMDTKTGQAMRRLLYGGDGKNFTPLLATRLVAGLGAVDAPDPIPGPPGDGVSAAEAKTIAEGVVRHATITPA